MTTREDTLDKALKQWVLIATLATGLISAGGNYLGALQANAVRDTKDTQRDATIGDLKKRMDEVDINARAKDKADAVRDAKDDAFKLEVIKRMDDIVTRVTAIEKGRK